MGSKANTTVLDILLDLRDFIFVINRMRKNKLVYTHVYSIASIQMHVNVLS